MVIALPYELEGITITGGEPFQQPEPLLALLIMIRNHTALSSIMLSRYTLDDIKTQSKGPEILSSLDVLIETPGDRASNQQVHLLTNRYSDADLSSLYSADVKCGHDNIVATMNAI